MNDINNKLDDELKKIDERIDELYDYSIEIRELNEKEEEIPILYRIFKHKKHKQHILKKEQELNKKNKDINRKIDLLKLKKEILIKKINGNSYENITQNVKVKTIENIKKM